MGEGVKKLKIATVYLGRRGGGNLYSLNLARELEKHFDQLCLLSSFIENKEDWQGFKKIYFVQTYRNFREYLVSLVFRGAIKEIKEKILEAGSSIVFFPMAHLWSASIVVALKKANPGIKVVTTLHDPILHPGEGNSWLWWLQHRLIKNSDGLVILSDVYRDKLVQRYRFKNEKILTLPHGPFHDFRFKRKAKREFEKKGSEEFLIGFVGRIKPYKGLKVLLEAFSNLQAANSSLRLLIAGDGNLTTQEQRLLNSIPSEKVLFVNRWLTEEEIAHFVDLSDVIVAPYTGGTQSGVVAIAFAMDKPVIVSDSGGLPEQVGYGKYGLITKAGDVQSLSTAIMRLYEDENLRQILVRNAREYIEHSINWENLARKLADFLVYV